MNISENGKSFSPNPEAVEASDFFNCFFNSSRNMMNFPSAVFELLIMGKLSAGK